MAPAGGGMGGWQHAPALGRDGGQTAMKGMAGRHRHTGTVQGQARAHKAGMVRVPASNSNAQKGNQEGACVWLLGGQSAPTYA